MIFSTSLLNWQKKNDYISGKGEDNMRTMAISKFKTYALRIIEEIAQNNEIIVITKHGKPLAKVIPFMEEENDVKMGHLSDTIIFGKDIMIPLGENI